MHTTSKLILLTTAATLGVVAPASADIVRTAAGNAAQIQSSVDKFRAEIGPDNGSAAPATFGRREVDFDSIPDSSADPNRLPDGDFAVRNGLRLSTPGSGLRVSADAANPSDTRAAFGGVNPTYPFTFGAFSPERLFSPIDSTITRGELLVPGTQTRATSSSFGVVLSDVDVNSVSSLSLFDASGAFLRSVIVPAAPGTGRLSFVGVRLVFGQRVARVILRTGEASLGPATNDTSRGGKDVVAIDNLIFGEPEAIPEVQVTPSPAAETAGAAVVNFVRDNLGGEVKIEVRATGGTATPGVDYFEAIKTNVRFGPGQRVARLVIPVLPDALREGDETIELEVSAGGAVEFRNGTRATVAIADGAPLVTPPTPGPRPAAPRR